MSTALLENSRIPPTLRLGVPGVGGWVPDGFGRGWPRRPDVWLETTLPGSPEPPARSVPGACLWRTRAARKPLCASRVAGPVSGSLTSRNRVLGQVAPWGTQESYLASRNGNKRLGLGVPKAAL